MSYDAQKAYCAKISSLRCYLMMPILSPNVLIETEIRIEATQLTRKIVTALL